MLRVNRLEAYFPKLSFSLSVYLSKKSIFDITFLVITAIGSLESYNEKAVRLIANCIKEQLGISLDEDDKQIEFDFKNN